MNIAMRFQAERVDDRFRHPDNDGEAENGEHAMRCAATGRSEGVGNIRIAARTAVASSSPQIGPDPALVAVALRETGGAWSCNGHGGPPR
jgi:hypothetical protein